MILSGRYGLEVDDTELFHAIPYLPITVDGLVIVLMLSGSWKNRVLPVLSVMMNHFRMTGEFPT